MKKQLPRIPFAPDFWAFSKAGKQLADIHVEYESLEPYPLAVTAGNGNYRVTKMKLFNSASKSKDTAPDSLQYNDHITFTGIPAEAFTYKVNGRSPLEWLVDRYQKKTHKESGIENDPNDWCNETGNERYIHDLIPRLVTLAVESQMIINSLPNWE